MTKITEMSGDSPSSYENEYKRVKDFVRGMLKTKLFVGIFHEKRFVQPLNAYRAVIRLSEDETELMENIYVAKKRLMKFYKGRPMWIGITEPHTIGTPAGYNLWVELDSEIIGSYWYNIKNVEFRENEICLKLKTVRPYRRESTPVHNVNSDTSEASTTFNVSEIRQQFTELIREKLTIENIKESTIFLGLFIMTLLTFLVHTIKYLMEYLLKFLHELQGIIKVSTPAFKTIVYFLSDCVRGVLNLLGSTFKSRNRPHQPPPQQYYITMGENFNPLHGNSNLRALPAPGNDNYQQPFSYQRPGVKITPLD